MAKAKAKPKAKIFKSLPRKAQKAAFAQMSDDGSLRKGGKKKSKSPALKKSSKVFPHVRTDGGGDLLSKSNIAYSKASASQKKDMLDSLNKNISEAKLVLRDKNINTYSPGAKKRRAEFISAARAFKKANGIK